MKTHNRAADAAVGYAADPMGRGIAYVALATGTATGVVRVPFTVKPLGALEGRENGYGAILAVATELRKRGYGRVALRLADEVVVDQLSGRRDVPPALGLPYVKARCALNGFASARVVRAEARDVADLEVRARAEVTLHVAA